MGMARAVDDRKLHSRHRNAYVALYVIGGLTVLLGLSAEVFRIAVLLQVLGSGWFAAAEGVVLLVLGYLTMRGSLLALGIALAIYGIDTVLALATNGIRGIVLRLVILYFLIQGFMALRTMKQRGRLAATQPSGPPAEPPTEPGTLSTS
jgi:hypothetical protein